VSDGRDPRVGRNARWACRLLLVGATVALLALFGDFGITWDEAVQGRYGELVLDYYLSGGSDVRACAFLDLYNYGPLFETLLAVGMRLVGHHPFEVRHLLTGLAALLTVVATGCLGRRFREPLVAPVAMLALIAMPRFVGHAFNNSKDIPFACAFAWSMLAALRLLESDRRRWLPVLWLAIAAGCAMAIRSGALMVFAIAGAGAFSLRLRTEQGLAPRARAIAIDAIRLGAALVAAWAVMVLCWPWAHAAPLSRPIASLLQAANFDFHYTVMFAGAPIDSRALPRSYLPHYIAIVTPVAILLPALGGLIVALRDGLGRRGSGGRLPALLLLCWIGLPLGWVVLARPNLYDGIRHFLFLLPALALACGLATAWIVGQAPARLKWAATIGLTIVVASPLIGSVRLHPYQSSYFNVFVGGLPGAAENYDVDYWASSYREASLWVRDRLDRPATVAVACNGHNRAVAAYFLEWGGRTPPLRTVCVWDGSERIPDDVTYFVGMRRYGKALSFFPDWPIVHRVEREGVWFSLVKRNPRFNDGGKVP
jgi:4-amino-4-deoxy-L-arabinose transferase-like glycosyltransferase